LNADDLPLLGEPLAIEFVNTLYGAGADRFDFLGAPTVVRLWLKHALGETAAVPSKIGERDVESLRALRDAALCLVSALACSAVPDATTVALVNREAAAGGAHPRLEWSHAVGPGSTMRFAGPRIKQLRAALAVACIELCTGTRPDALRRCEGPDCSLWFVQHDRRRRFCHESCSHRARQRKYWRSRSCKSSIPT
jgi:predicted RNA-binding Zn ribbon-like protein